MSQMNSSESMDGSTDDGLPEFPARFYAGWLYPDFDVDSQLEAIHDLLRRNREIEESQKQEIRRSDEYARELKGVWNDRAVEDHISLLHASVYQDAAHSMAAVGMLAPFLETIFTQCFLGIGEKWPTNPSSTHERWQAPRAFQWDCHKFVANGRASNNLVQGILQLADAIGLQTRFPTDIEKTLSALFTYRNKMFHCGFEWPKDERERFQKQIDDGHWPGSWFATSTIAGKPWIFYLTNEFIEHCLTTTEQVLAAFGAFARDEIFHT